MNKRIKRKRWLEIKVAELIARMELTFQVLKTHKSKIEDLEEIQEQNALSDNNRFDKLESENKGLRIIIREMKRQLKPKRSLFGRK